MRTPPVLNKAVLASLALVLAIIAPGCNLVPPNRPSEDAVYTAGAATLIARLTSDARGTAAAQLPTVSTPTKAGGPPPKQPSTPTPQPSDTPAPPSLTPAPIETTPAPTPTPTVTAVTAPCNLAELMGDVTVPLDTIFSPGTLLTKVWRARNIGSCTWGSGYVLVYTSGNLVASQVTPLPAAVPPGQIVDLSVALTVPTGAGAFQGSWMLRSDSGQVFGTGTDGSVPFYTRIQVLQPTSAPITSYDFTDNFCSFAWRSADGALACPGQQNDRDGSVILIQSAVLEARRANAPGLWTRPNRSASGWISGQTPLLGIRNGDHFITEVGCLNGSPNCDVLFQFDYLAADGSSGRLGQWREVTDGVTTPVDIDLSFLAGRSSAFTLTVYNRGAQRDANAVWIDPRIQTGVISRSMVLTWTREGQPNTNSCDKLTIVHTGANSAVAIAYDCAATTFELGRATLAASQMQQLINWERQLSNFEGEIYSATGGHPVTAWISFRGQGQGVAGEPEFQVLNSFAAQIFNFIVR